MPAPSRGLIPGRAATLTIRPPLAPPGPGSVRVRIALIAAREQRKHDSAFIFNCPSKWAALVSATEAIANPPARWIEAQRRQPGVKALHRRFVGEVDPIGHMHPRVVAMGVTV